MIDRWVELLATSYQIWYPFDPPPFSLNPVALTAASWKKRVKIIGASYFCSNLVKLEELEKKLMVLVFWELFMNNTSRFKLINNLIRMHSSRMRASRLSGHLGGVCLGGVCLVCCLLGGGVCPGGFCLGGCTPEVHAGIHTPSAHCMLGYTSPLLCGLTDTCENITFPQLLLRAVIIRSTILAKCVDYSSIHAKCCSQNTFETRNSYTIPD